MAEFPIYPQAEPALQYIVEQVSKIDNAQACTTGYYKSHKDLLRRLEKIDTELTRLRGLIDGLTPDDAARYFKEGMDQALGAIHEESQIEIGKNVDQAISRLNASSKKFEQSVDDVERRMKILKYDLKESDTVLNNAVEKASKHYVDAYSNAIKTSEFQLTTTVDIITEQFQKIVNSQMDLQYNFENLARDTLKTTPLINRIFFYIIVFGAGMCFSEFLIKMVI